MQSSTSTSTITINAPAEKVWRALTDPAQVKLWQYGSDLITSWQPGTSIRFVTPWGDKIFEQWGLVMEFIPHTQLKYSLFAPRPDLEDKPENLFFMTYLLSEKNGATQLSIIQDDPRPGATTRADDESGNAILNGLKKLAEK